MNNERDAKGDEMGTSVGEPCGIVQDQAAVEVINALLTDDKEVDDEKGEDEKSGDNKPWVMDNDILIHGFKLVYTST